MIIHRKIDKMNHIKISNIFNLKLLLKKEPLDKFELKKKFKTFKFASNVRRTQRTIQ